MFKKLFLSCVTGIMLVTTAAVLAHVPYLGKLPCDYTANIGIVEAFSEEDKMRERIIIPLYSDHMLLHFPCVDMEGLSPFDIDGE